jgi:hypothetical protein
MSDSDACSSEDEYPRYGQEPTTHNLSACEVLCWIGYRRPIPKELYYSPLRASPWPVLPSLMHDAVPDPKPAQCPIADAQQQLMSAIRSGKLAPYCIVNSTPAVMPPSAYKYAFVIYPRGSLEPDDAAADSDRELAESQQNYRGVHFFTTDVLKLWPANGEVVPESCDLGKTKKRRSNGPDYREKDALLVAEMQDLIATHRARSSEDAARAVVKRAVGGGTDESKVKRLTKRYREA